MKNAMMAFALLLLAGCATKEMKSTPFYEGSDVVYAGKPEDRVNVWPIAYWREPVGSVLWPITSFSDDHFALRPIYSQYKQDGKDGAFDEFNFLWPLCQADTKNDDYFVFPFFWGKDSKQRPYQALFPIYWNGDGYNSLFPLWIYRDSDSKSHLSVVAGIAGASAEKTKGREANWCFPLWYWNNKGTFVTTVYGQWKNGWAVPPLFSWGESETNGNWSSFFLLGLGGATNRGGRFKQWAFPFYSRNEYTSRDTNQVCKTQLLMNLAGWESIDDGVESSYFFPLYGWKKDKWLLTPLFYWNRNGSLFTPLGGRTISGATTNVYVTPLVKATSGEKTGGMVFPLWKHEKHCGFDEKADWLDGERLTDSIRIWTAIETNRVWNKKKKCYDSVTSSCRRATAVYSEDKTDWLLLFPWNDYVRGTLGYCSRTNSYYLTRRINRGASLLCKYEWTREATYSALDRSKQSDTENSDASFLIWLYNYKHENDLMKADAYTQHRVLWRLWDWEEKNGDVTLDVFPGFTYDSKTNGYAKTSFLWRFFRYENDPEKGTSADFLFIPVWR